MAIEPNFFIIGATKAATTSLASLLALHPQAAIVQGKEPHFFSYDHVYRLGWDKYLALYNHCTNQKAIGDASTSYSRIRYHPFTPNRIRHHVPNAKIIYMVRHPLKRMESAYVEHLSTPGGRVFRSVNDAVRHLPMIIDSSRYWEVFNTYRQIFTEARVKVVWFEEYTTNTAAIFQDVCRFLEIDDSVTPDLSQENKHSRDQALSRIAPGDQASPPINTEWDAGTRQWVISQLREDNCKFLTHFGRPLNYWGDLF